MTRRGGRVQVNVLQFNELAERVKVLEAEVEKLKSKKAAEPKKRGPKPKEGVTNA